MSHVVSIKTLLYDLDAVKATCAEMGLVFKENQKTHRWYGTWVRDYNAANAAYRNGIDPSTYGKCDHAILVPGSNYDIGLVKDEKTNGYKMVFDFWGQDGRKIQQTIGENGGKFLQAYAANVATKAAQAKGYTVKREMVGGKIKLTVSIPQHSTNYGYQTIGGSR